MTTCAGRTAWQPLPASGQKRQPEKGLLHRQTLSIFSLISSRPGSWRSSPLPCAYEQPRPRGQRPFVRMNSLHSRVL